MAANQGKALKTNYRSTDRGGLFSLAAAVLLIALGAGWMLGLRMPNSYSLIELKNMALGLGGALHWALPPMAVWLGALMAASAHRYVSFRSYWVLLALLVLVMGIMTLVTPVGSDGMLMDYLRSMQANFRQADNAQSLGSYLSSAYLRYQGLLKPDPLVGGGALGMLVAYPAWRLLGSAGGAVLLAFAAILMALVLLRFNPVARWQKAAAKKHGGQPQPDAQDVPPGGDNAAPVPEAAPAAGAMAGGEVFVQAAYPTAPGQPVPAEFFKPAPTQPESFARPAAFRAEEEAPAPFAKPAAEPAAEGFVSVQKEFYEIFEPAPRRASPINGREVPLPDSAAETLDFTGEIAVPPLSALLMEASGDSGQEIVQQEALAGQSRKRRSRRGQDEEAPGPDAAIPAKQMQDIEPVELVAPPAAAEPRGRARQKQPQEVGVGPAVQLSGEKIAVRGASGSGLKAAGLDGMAKTPAKDKQISFRMVKYERPLLRLLSEAPAQARPDTTREDNERAEKLIQTLTSFNIAAQVQQIVHGPAITRFAIRLAEGVNVNRLRNVMDNIAVELLAKSPIRAEIPIPGTYLIGIEVSNDHATTVYLSEVLNSPKMQEAKSPTMVALGKDITGAPVLCDLMDMPHLLIAGATGSGKSVCINSIITSLLYGATPDMVRLILVDPKFVELQPYNDVPHLMLPVITDPKKAVSALEWVCQEMDERYQKLQKAGARNLDAYNMALAPDEEPLPRIVVIVDEMADLMATCGKIIDEHVKRITAKARAAGICLILATQRPSVDVITGVIKANIPSRIAFQVSSLVDSRTILDMPGAEKLLGYGDMLYLPRNLSSPKRVQGCFISDKDVARVVEYIKSRNQAEYNVDIMEHLEKDDNGNGAQGAAAEGEGDEGAFDELLPKAIEMAVEAGQMSISMLQRVLRVGYGRAGRLIDEMARRSIISGNEGTKPRKTLISREEYNALYAGDEQL